MSLCLVLGNPRLSAGLQLWGRSTRRGRSTALELLAALLWVQPRMWLAVFERAHCQLLFIRLSSRIFSCGTAFQPASAHPVLLHWLLCRPCIFLLQSSWGSVCPASLDPGFWPVDHFPIFGIVHRLAENIFCPISLLGSKDVKQHGCQYESLRKQHCLKCQYLSRCLKGVGLLRKGSAMHSVS